GEKDADRISARVVKLIGHHRISCWHADCHISERTRRENGSAPRPVKPISIAGCIGISVSHSRVRQVNRGYSEPTGKILGCFYFARAADQAANAELKTQVAQPRWRVQKKRGSISG